MNQDDNIKKNDLIENDKSVNEYVVNDLGLVTERMYSIENQFLDNKNIYDFNEMKIDTIHPQRMNNKIKDTTTKPSTINSDYIEDYGMIGRQYCLCDIDSMINDITNFLYGSSKTENFIELIDNYICRKFFNIKTGIHINSDRFNYIILNESKQKTNHCNLIQKSFTSNVYPIYTEDGMCIKIPCTGFYEMDSPNYVWQDNSKEFIKFGKVDSQSGMLLIENVTPQMDGYYTCNVQQNNKIIQQNQYQLSVISFPKYTLKIHLMYSIVNGKCDANILEMVYLNLANEYHFLICGKYRSVVCSLYVNHVQCVLQKDKTRPYLSLNVIVVVMENTQPMLVNSNVTNCDIFCKIKISNKLIYIIKNNLPKLLHIPVLFKLLYKNFTLTPQANEIIAGRDLIVMDTTCKAGFGLKTDSFICVPCEKNYFNSGNSSYCLQCPRNTYQHLKGSAFCNVCNGLFKDRNCFPFDFNINELIRITIVFFIIGLICIIIYYKYFKSQYNIRESTSLNAASFESHNEEDFVCGPSFATSYITMDDNFLSNCPKFQKQPPRPPTPDFF